MSDQRVRALERRWRATKSLADEVAYLTERLRAGDLTLERIEVAAQCDHEAARQLVNAPTAVFPAWAIGILVGGEYLYGLALNFGTSPVLVATASAMRTALDWWDADHRDAPAPSELRKAVSAAERWLRSPTALNRAKVAGLAERAMQAKIEFGLDHGFDDMDTDLADSLTAVNLGARGFGTFDDHEPELRPRLVIGACENSMLHAAGGHIGEMNRVHAQALADGRDIRGKQFNAPRLGELHAIVKRDVSAWALRGHGPLPA